MKSKNKTYIICYNFKECKNSIDVTEDIPRSVATYRTRPATHVMLCPECSQKKYEEKKKENPTLFKEK